MALEDLKKGVQAGELGHSRPEEYFSGGHVEGEDKDKKKDKKKDKEAKKDKEDEVEKDVPVLADDNEDPAPDPEEGNENQADADDVIDSFLKQNPELIEIDPEEWPEEKMAALKKALDSGAIDTPNGLSTDEEAVAASEEMPSVDEESAGDDNAEIHAMIDAGDFEAARDALDGLIGGSPDVVDEPISDMDVPSKPNEGGNALAKLMGSFNI